MCTEAPATTPRIAAPPNLHNAAVDPSSPHVIAALSSPALCEAVRNATTTPSVIPPSTRPLATGSTPHEHSGVANPTNAPFTNGKEPLPRWLVPRANDTMFIAAVISTPSTTQG